MGKKRKRKRRQPRSPSPRLRPVEEILNKATSLAEAGDIEFRLKRWSGPCIPLKGPRAR